MCGRLSCLTKSRRRLSEMTALRPFSMKSGKMISRSLHPGDGCHRLALLLLTDITELQPEWYAVESMDQFEPPDHTFGLLPHLQIDEKKYAEFISAYFGVRFEKTDELISWVSENASSHKRELLDVLRIDDLIRRLGG